MAPVTPLSDLEQKAAREIAEYLLEHPLVTRKEVDRIKAKFSKKYHVPGMIRNAAVLEMCSPEESQNLSHLLRRKITRTLSGVAVIAVMTKPVHCPGQCIYCPGKSSQPGEAAAQSYTGKEPAARRSIMFNYDSRQQVASRIEDLEAIGHKVDKVEIICMGGTLCAAPTEYQDEFVKGCYDGLLGIETDSLSDAKLLAESSDRRLVGITFETRPDYCQEDHVNKMLDYGGTRVEIGVQTVFDDIYERVHRGHTTADTKNAFRVAKDAGLKINAHMMPNLPGATLERDREAFQILFEDSAYRPDMLKIYPTLVVRGTQLYDLYAAGEYAPYALDDVVKLIADVKSNLPPYVRIQRVQRDIPANLIVAGVKKSNLRELVQDQLRKTGKKCTCIRCREEGVLRHLYKQQIDFNQIQLHR
ncbi:MAG TPA: tRNA uridine(34) 5-carboxymethylaminomethyl modification radical SAM/GNAT enzyme Elp3, partial [Candidatus Lokiarchaeia archaeon]|nr:tRNA uridine(34) 5-carboxymethylaminomethyl modification radical SAM/GNAT enzyme Elp3 [Candidatus Lokiarchaeia archaeon]